MKRILLILFALTLFACGSAPEEDRVEVQEKLDTPTAKVEHVAENSAELEPEPTTASDDDDNAENVEVQSVAPAIDSLISATTPEEAQLLRQNDHFKGATDPEIVLVEYSDFQ